MKHYEFRPCEPLGYKTLLLGLGIPTPLGLAFCFYQLVIHNHIACVNFPLARARKYG